MTLISTNFIEAMPLKIAKVKYEGDHLKIEFSNGEVFSVSLAAAFELKPAAGTLLDYRLEENIRIASESFDCRQRALKLLSTRSHSEKELADKLALRKFSPAAIANTLSELKKASLLNDKAFAAEYAERRASAKAIGIRRITAELSQRGVSADIIKEALTDAELNEEGETERCVSAAEKKLKSLSGKRNAEAKLAAFLKQKGFGWNAVQKTLAMLEDKLNADGAV